MKTLNDIEKFQYYLKISISSKSFNLIQYHQSHLNYSITFKEINLSCSTL
nr:MAG TPA: hypothetical protein [Bacteriophage sp.]